MVDLDRVQESDELLVNHMNAPTGRLSTALQEATIVRVVFGTTPREAAGKIMATRGASGKCSHRKFRSDGHMADTLVAAIDDLLYPHKYLAAHKWNMPSDMLFPRPGVAD